MYTIRVAKNFGRRLANAMALSRALEIRRKTQKTHAGRECPIAWHESARAGEARGLKEF
jgi:hypothetical protein